MDRKETLQNEWEQMSAVLEMTTIAFSAHILTFNPSWILERHACTVWLNSSYQVIFLVAVPDAAIHALAGQW